MRLVLALIVSALLLSCAPQARLQPPAADRLYSVEALAARVHVLTQGDVFHVQGRGNVEVIEQGSGVVLVDSGGSPAGAEEVIALVRRLTSKPVTAIVLTHWHGDHVLGVSRLLQEWPRARVIATAPTRDMLASAAADRFMPGDNAEANRAYHANNEGAAGYLRQQSEDAALPAAVRQGYSQAAQEYARFAREMLPARRVAPTEIFEERLVLPDGETPVEVRFLGRANTEGDAIVWLPRQRIVMTGDVVVSPIPYGFNSYPTEWLAVLAHIKALQFSVLVPGHGTPMRDSGYVNRLIAVLADISAQTRELAGDASITQENLAAHVDLGGYESVWAGQDPWLRLWFNRYWTGPIAWSALREARGEAIVQGGD